LHQVAVGDGVAASKPAEHDARQAVSGRSATSM